MKLLKEKSSRVSNLEALRHVFPTCIYADDTLIMGSWNKGNIRTILRLLHCFGLVLGLKPNLAKTRLVG